MEQAAHLAPFYVAVATLLFGAIGGLFLAAAKPAIPAWLKAKFHI
jgi:ABC-type uncharacterized transport system permease subunit